MIIFYYEASNPASQHTIFIQLLFWQLYCNLMVSMVIIVLGEIFAPFEKRRDYGNVDKNINSDSVRCRFTGNGICGSLSNRSTNWIQQGKRMGAHTGENCRT